MADPSPVNWLSRAVLELVPAGPIHAVLEAPASKSLTNRLLVIAALADGTSVLRHVLESDDTDAMIGGLRALGARIELGGGVAEVTGTAGRPVAGPADLSAGLSGTTLRFLAAVALLARGTVVIDGEEPLRRRPIAPLAEALRAAGADVATDGGRPPLRIRSRGVGRRPAPGRRVGQLPVRHGPASGRALCRGGRRSRRWRGCATSATCASRQASWFAGGPRSPRRSAGCYRVRGRALSPYVAERRSPSSTTPARGRAPVRARRRHGRIDHRRKRQGDRAARRGLGRGPLGHGRRGRPGSGGDDRRAHGAS